MFVNSGVFKGGSLRNQRTTQVHGKREERQIPNPKDEWAMALPWSEDSEFLLRLKAALETSFLLVMF